MLFILLLLNCNLKKKNMAYSEKNKYENEFRAFLINRIQTVGGSIKFQHISGHLSQLKPEVRQAIGTSKSDLSTFITKNNDIFHVDKEIVSLIRSTTSLPHTNYDSDSSSYSQSAMPEVINNGKGVIIKLFPEFGFIKAKEPIKTEVCFLKCHFEGGKTSLTESLYVGCMVQFNAKKRKSEKYTTKYITTKLWKFSKIDAENNIIQNRRKSRETGLYDPLNLDGEGVIQKIFPHIGFIAVDGDENNTVFFYKNRLLHFDNIVDLTNCLKKGDLVEFSAHRTTKRDAKARWEAIKVWKKSSRSNLKKKNNVSSDISESSSKLSSSDKLDKKSKCVMNEKNGTHTKEMIKNERGKICPRSHGAVIKFGENFNQLADGDSSLYYTDKCQVEDISWIFSEGDDVFFDAVKIKSAPGWKAVLVWVGEKPDIVLRTCLGDFSEFTDDECDEIPGEFIYPSNLNNYQFESCSSSAKSVSINSESSIHATEEEKPANIISEGAEVYSNKETIQDLAALSQQNSQDSICSKESTKCHKSVKEFKKKHVRKHNSTRIESFVSWGDSPYPDEDYQNASSCEGDISNSTSLENIPNSIVEVDETLNISKYSYSGEKVSDEPRGNGNDSKFSVSREEMDSKSRDDEIISDRKDNSEGDIKKMQNIDGQINRVFSKYAEIKSCHLENPVSFFWTSFYYNGISVEDLHVDDLKDVIKVGDAVCFNYFEIIDDTGQKWEKVSLAWSGPKPVRSTEMTPEDFIKQNNLSVTVHNKHNTDHVKVLEMPRRKFLTAFDDISPDLENEKCVSRTESCSEDDDTSLSIKNSEENKLFKVSLPPSNFKTLSQKISEMLNNKDLSLDPEVDTNSLSVEIINLILEFYNGKKSADNTCDVFPFPKGNCNQKTADAVCSSYEENTVSDVPNLNIEVKDCETQTVITGEIIAQSIFIE